MANISMPYYGASTLTEAASLGERWRSTRRSENNLYDNSARIQNPTNPMLSLAWAPDVYDPGSERPFQRSLLANNYFS